MCLCSHTPHQEASSTILYILEPLKAPARDANERCIAVTGPGGDEGRDRLFCILEGRKGTELGHIFQRMPTFQVFPTRLLQFPPLDLLIGVWTTRAQIDLCCLVGCCEAVGVLRLWLD